MGTLYDVVDRVGTGRAALAGLVGAGVSLGTAELCAGILPDVPSFVVAVGDAVIDNSPGWFVRFGIDNLGTSDKPGLITGIVVISLLLGAALGVVARRWWPIAAAGFAAFGVVGVTAAARLPLTSLAWSIVTAMLAVVAIVN